MSVENLCTIWIVRYYPSVVKFNFFPLVNSFNVSTIVRALICMIGINKKKFSELFKLRKDLK